MKKENLEIILEVDQLGDFNLEVINGNGKNCLQASAQLESALGIVSERKFKSEYRHGQFKHSNQVRVSCPQVQQMNKTQLRN